MKKTIFTVLMLSSLFAQAKVSDFNALIKESAAEQKKLTQELGEQMEARRKAFQRRDPVYLVEEKSDAINVRSGKNLLRFQKEVVDHSADADIQKQVAQELKSSELQY